MRTGGFGVGTGTVGEEGMLVGPEDSPLRARRHRKLLARCEESVLFRMHAWSGPVTVVTGGCCRGGA